MSTPRRFRLNRQAAERALDGSGSTGSAQLDGLLESAAAVPTGDVPGEQAAMAAFRGAQAQPLIPIERETLMQRTARLLTAKAVAAGVAVVVGTGGIALAATGTIDLPGKSEDAPGQVKKADSDETAPAADDSVTSAPGEDETETTTPGEADPSESPSDDSTDQPGDADEAGETGDEGEDGEARSTAPNPSLQGLCNAFQAGERNGHPKDLTVPSFAVLAEAAGGAENVATYCVDLIGEPKTKPEKKEKPEKPAHPEQAQNGDKPEKPAHPEQAQNGDKPAKPEKKEKPEKPAHPEQAQNGDKPAKPENKGQSKKD